MAPRLRSSTSIRNSQSSRGRASAHGKVLGLISAARLSRFAAHGLSAMLAVVLLVTTAAAAVPNGAAKLVGSAAPGLQSAAPQALDAARPYVVRLGESNLALVADPADGDLDARAWEVRRAEVAAALDELAEVGSAGAYTYDEAARAFRVDLNTSARESLSANPHVASVEPWSETALARPAAESEGLPLNWYGDGVRAQDVTGISSVAFIQVHSPFMWGRVNIGGLSVRLLLYDADGTTVIGGPSQVTALGTGMGQRCNADTDTDSMNAIKDAVKIDPGQLYFETVFRACNSEAPVMIRPGHKVRVMTIGDNPATPVEDPDDLYKYVTVDDVKAWTSYEYDWVKGQGPANASVVVTSAGSLNLGSYLTPGTSMTYAEVTTDASGNFTVPTFRTTSNPTYSTVNLVQGSRGFVRVIHPVTGDEVYTVHGQNALVLENSSIVHGYAYQLPMYPSGLVTTPRITVNRPNTTVDVVVTGPGGSASATVSPDPNGWYTAFLAADIVGGSTVEVAINGNSVHLVNPAPITAGLDIQNNQVVGSTAPNTPLIVAVGRINGYVAKNSTYTYVQQRVTSGGTGAYQTGQIKCGTTNYLRLGPGSFGYVGYEDPRGNFVYMAFAGTANYVMVDYPLIEGWVAHGLVRPNITVKDSGGTSRHQSTAAPMPIYLLNQKIYVNVYYAEFTTAYTAAGDVVTITSGGPPVQIPVPSQGIAGYLNDESDVVSGHAPPGTTIKVIPSDDRYSYKQTVVDGTGRFGAQNPYTSLNVGSCTESTKTQDFTQGDYGRVYLRYADGNEVFAFYGRGMSANQNENRLELWLWAYQGIDWTIPPYPVRTAQVKLIRNGATLADTLVPANTLTGEAGHGTALITNAQGRVVIRAGDRLEVTFNEGPDDFQRPTTMIFKPIALLTATPDVETNTVAGVGPTIDWQQGRGWSGGGWQGRAWITSHTGIKASNIQARNITAYSPVGFVTNTPTNPQPITLTEGYAGNVSFSNDYGHKVWVAWAVTANPVKITPPLREGTTVVCGKAPPGQTVSVYDVISDPESGTTELRLIGTGTANAQGLFCVTVSPPLIRGHVIIAESGGVYSQPVVVTVPVFLPFVRK